MVSHGVKSECMSFEKNLKLTENDLYKMSKDDQNPLLWLFKALSVV